MRLLGRVLWALLFVGLLVFGWQFAHGNADPVRVHLPMVQLPPIALWQILLFTFLLGGSVVSMVLGVGLLRARLEGRRYRKAIRALESEVHQLRHLPASPGGSREATIADVGVAEPESRRRAV